MNKKPPAIRFSKMKVVAQSDDRSWHGGGDIEIRLYARSLHRAAKTLLENLKIEPNPQTTWDAGPVILLYRQAIELHLKLLVGEGGRYLPSPTDPITLYKTHSLRWLAQIVCQIIRGVSWENSFKCECVATLADFSALVNQLEDLDPVSCAVHSHSHRSHGSLPYQPQPTTVVRLAKTLDTLLDLLDVTADALAAEWDQQGDVLGFDWRN